MMLLNPYRFAAAGGIGAVTSGLVLALDPASYSSGQVWANGVASPADGAAQADYDFNRGDTASSEGSDPTHAGTYWTFDGGDYLTAAASATAFIEGMHKAGAQFTLECWHYYAGDGGNVNPLFDGGTSDQGGPDMSRGILFGDAGSQINPAGRFGLRVKRDSGGASAMNAYLAATPSTSTWHHSAVSYDGTGAVNSFLWLDGAQATNGATGTLTWDGTPTTPGTLDPTAPARIGCRGDTAFRVANGTRIGIVRIYNRPLTSAEMLQNWNADRATYGL